MHPRYTMSVCALGDDDMGADDSEGSILLAASYIDESTGVSMQDGLFTVPADAFRDKITMEWILAHKDDASSETDAVFNEQIM